MCSSRLPSHSSASCCCPSITTRHHHAAPAIQLAHIAERAAPTTWQSALLPAKGRPGIGPIMMACPPGGGPEDAAAEEDVDGGDDGEGPPPLIAALPADAPF